MLVGLLGAAGLNCNHPPTGTASLHLEPAGSPVSQAVPGWPLSDSVRVRVVTQNGEPKAGALVAWSVQEGDGLLSQALDTSGVDGYSAIRWTLGPLAGMNRLRATAVDGDSLDFDVVGTAFRADRVTSSYGLGCGIVGTTLWCWGDGFWNSTAPVSERSAFGWRNLGPGLVDAEHEYVDIATGVEIVCGLDAAGTVRCARGSKPDEPPSLLPGLPPLSAFTLARMTTGAGCGLAVVDSTPWCWETGGTPAAVSGSPPLTTVRVGGTSGHILACGLRVDSAAVCWGEGPLGDGTTSPSSTPVQASGDHHFAQLVVGWDFACGRTAGGEAWCWGKDHEEFSSAGSPVLVPTLALSGVRHLATSEHQVQARTATGYVRWYGAGFELGQTPMGLSFPPPGQESDALECSLVLDREVYCYDEMFDGSSLFLYNTYSPIQPARAP